MLMLRAALFRFPRIIPFSVPAPFDARSGLTVCETRSATALIERTGGCFWASRAEQSGRDRCPGTNQPRWWRELWLEIARGDYCHSRRKPPVGGPPPLGNIQPILDYDRSVGGTIIGGYVYRGSQIPALQGKYIFGDYLAGKIFAVDYDGTTASNFQDITSMLFPTRTGGFNLASPSSFGEDADGELYIVDIAAGAVYKIVP